MTVRPFHWRDLPALNRCRRHSVFLDSALLLTRGPWLVTGSLMSMLSSAMGFTTYILTGGEAQPPDAHDTQSVSAQPVQPENLSRTIFGQLRHRKGSPFAHLTYLTPDTAMDSSAMVALLDAMVGSAGERGAYHLLAEVDETAHAFESLRHAGFYIYSRQRIWKLSPDKRDPLTSTLASQKEKHSTWRIALSKDVVAIRTLYNNLVSGLVQQVEPFLTLQRPNGLVLEQGGELKAFVEVKYGPRGIWTQPFFHPNVEDINEHLAGMLASLVNSRTRPVYVCVRSYQSWMEPALEAMNAEVGARQAVMAKHMTVPVKAIRSVKVTTLEGGRSGAPAVN